jgi:hypothetical protein
VKGWGKNKRGKGSESKRELKEETRNKIQKKNHNFFFFRRFGLKELLGFLGFVGMEKEEE